MGGPFDGDEQVRSALDFVQRERASTRNERFGLMTGTVERRQRIQRFIASPTRALER